MDLYKKFPRPNCEWQISTGRHHRHTVIIDIMVHLVDLQVN